jgi:hypothetical protein
MAPRKSTPCWLFRHVANPDSRPAYISHRNWCWLRLESSWHSTGYDRIRSWQSKGKVQCNSRLKHITYIYMFTMYVDSVIV